MITPTPADTEVRQLVVHPTVWPYLTAWLDARSIDVNLMTPASDDDLATYVMSPRDLATEPEAPAAHAQRPQERPGAVRAGRGHTRHAERAADGR